MERKERRDGDGRERKERRDGDERERKERRDGDGRERKGRDRRGRKGSRRRRVHQFLRLKESVSVARQLTVS